MNTVAQQKLSLNRELTRADIADVLKSVGKPGEKRDEKIAAVREMCEAMNTGRNTQGHPIWDTLDEWEDF